MPIRKVSILFHLACEKSFWTCETLLWKFEQLEEMVFLELLLKLCLACSNIQTHFRWVCLVSNICMSVQIFENKNWKFRHMLQYILDNFQRHSKVSAENSGNNQIDIQCFLIKPASWDHKFIYSISLPLERFFVCICQAAITFLCV